MRLQERRDGTLRICVVGSGTRFLSGISYYTLCLSHALAKSHQVSVILMRQLLPTRFYPGRERVGTRLTDMCYDPAIQVLDGVDWYWLPSIFRAFALLLRQWPEMLVLQWWSGTVLHTYAALVLVAKLLGARVIVEFHEVLDTGEERIPLARLYVRMLAPLLMSLADGFVIHSEYDRPLLEQRYGLGQRPVALIPLGPYKHYWTTPPVSARDAPASCCNLLYFGVVRPFKGLEDLLLAFEEIPETEIARYWLTIVGETWEGCTRPAELIVRSRYRDRITLVNRYVRDEEVTAFFAGADAVVLPYRRSSASGPLHMAMSYGLPVVVTRVGGLVEAVSGYEGAILIPPEDPRAIRQALAQVATLRGRRFSDPHSWERTGTRYQALFHALGSASARMYRGADQTTIHAWNQHDQ